MPLLPPELLRRGKPGSIPVRRLPIRPRGIRRLTFGLTLGELLAMDEFTQGTTLERIVDGAARRLGIRFNGYGVKLSLSVAGRRTVVDRVLLLPGRTVLIYIDGPQHYLRPNQMQVDAMQTMELESYGYEVVRLKYQDLMDDPIGTLRRNILLRMAYG